MGLNIIIVYAGLAQPRSCKNGYRLKSASDVCYLIGRLKRSTGTHPSGVRVLLHRPAMSVYVGLRSTAATGFQEIRVQPHSANHYYGLRNLSFPP